MKHDTRAQHMTDTYYQPAPREIGCCVGARTR